MNIKRGRQLKEIKLRGMKPTKRDLVNIEKIVLKRIKPSDHYVIQGKKKDVFLEKSMQWSSARYLPNGIKYFRNTEVVFKVPNISVRFNRLSTRITAQRVYSKGDTLVKVDECIDEINKYLTR